MRLWHLIVPTMMLMCRWPIEVNGLLKGATQVDELRAYYLMIEQNMWAIAQSGNDHSHVLDQIFEGHRIFVDDNITLVPNTLHDFKLLETVYEWKLLETDIITLDNLFEALRLLLRENLQRLDELQATDFADTVFKDTHYPVNGTLEKIDNIMIKQGMYYKAMLVGTPMWSTNCEYIFCFVFICLIWQKYFRNIHERFFRFCIF